MKRIDTGIEGFDSILGGGIPKGMMVLIEGEPGSGKSNIGLEFLYRGALEGKNGLYVSFQENEKEVLRTTTFEWRFEEMVEKNMIEITKFDPYRHEQIADMLRSKAMENNAERIVLDPITDLDLYIDSRKDQRKNLLNIKEEIRSMNATCLLTAEQEESAELEEEVVDGIVELSLDKKKGELGRSLFVKKLKGTDFDHSVHSYRFKPDGIKVE